MGYGGILRRCAVTAVLIAMIAAHPAQAQRARVGGLVDVNFGTISAATEQTNRQDVVVCSYQGQPHSLNYSVTAIGSGPGGAFAVSAGPASLPYDVQWADLPGQTGGTLLQAGVTASGFGNAANGFDCSGQPETASLTVTIRAPDIASAQAGSYSGNLQITIAPE